MSTGLLYQKDILLRFDTLHPDTHVNIKQSIILNGEETEVKRQQNTAIV